MNNSSSCSVKDSLPTNPADVSDVSYLGGVHTPRASLGATVVSQACSSPWPTAVDSGVAQESKEAEVKRAKKASMASVGTTQRGNAATPFPYLSATSSQPGTLCMAQQPIVAPPSMVTSPLAAAGSTTAAGGTSRGTSSIGRQGRQGAMTTTGRLTVNSWPSREDMDVDSPVCESAPRVESFPLPTPLPCTINGWNALVHFQAYSDAQPQQLLITPAPRPTTGTGGAANMPVEGKRERVVHPFRLLMHVSDNSRLTVLQAQSRSGYIVPPATGPARLMKPGQPAVPPLRLPANNSQDKGRQEEGRRAQVASESPNSNIVGGPAGSTQHAATPHPLAPGSSTGFWRGLIQSTLGAVTPATWGYGSTAPYSSGGQEGTAGKAHAQGWAVTERQAPACPNAGRVAALAQQLHRTEDETSSSSSSYLAEENATSASLLTPLHGQTSGRWGVSTLQRRDTDTCT